MKLLVLIAASLAALAWAQDTPYLSVGSVAPDFSGKAANGEAVSLKTLTKEKPVFVVFWKERCPHNPRASALFNSLSKAYQGKAKLVGIVSATNAGAKKWTEQFAVNYPLLGDPDKKLIDAYKLVHSICTFQIGTDGKIAKVFPGYGIESLSALNTAMADVAKTPLPAVDLSKAPKQFTFG